MIGIISEDLPTKTNLVDLSPGATDELGFAVPRFVYKVTDNTKALLEWNLDRASESLQEAGATHVETAASTRTGHPMGTTRMGDDSRRSVVDRWGRCHDVANLFVVGSSVFVTAGAVNPTSTVCALSLRTAEHILRSRSAMPQPASPTASRKPVSFVYSRTRQSRSASERTQREARTFSPLELQTLERLGESLIPASHGMPSPVEVGLSERLLQRVIVARPDIIDDLHRALSVSCDDPDETVADLWKSDPEAAAALELTVAGGYYMHPRVRALIGYYGEAPHSASPDIYPEYVAEGLLDFMLEPSQEGQPAN
jgi:hypothetical protein